MVNIKEVTKTPPKDLDNKPLFKGVKVILRPFTKGEFAAARVQDSKLSMAPHQLSGRRPLDIMNCSAVKREPDENGDKKIVYYYALSDGNSYREDWLELPDFSIRNFTKIMRGNLVNAAQK